MECIYNLGDWASPSQKAHDSVHSAIAAANAGTGSKQDVRDAQADANSVSGGGGSSARRRAEERATLREAAVRSRAAAVRSRAAAVRSRAAAVRSRAEHHRKIITSIQKQDLEQKQKDARQRHTHKINSLQRQMTSEMRNAKNWKETLQIKKRYTSIDPALGTHQKTYKDGKLVDTTGIIGSGYEPQQEVKPVDHTKPIPPPQKAELHVTPPLQESKLDIIGDEKDEIWHTPFQVAYAEEQKQRESESNIIPSDVTPHNPDVTHLSENNNAVSVGGVPLEASRQTEKNITWNQRVHRSGQMIGTAPSMGQTENSVTDFFEGMAAPVENYGIMIQNKINEKRKPTPGAPTNRRFQRTTRDDELSPDLIPYKETLLDNVISGKEPTRSPAYYAGSAISDTAMIVAPIPGTRVALGVKTAVRGMTNLKKAQRIAKVTQEKGIIDTLEKGSNVITKQGKNTKVPVDPIIKRLRLEKLHQTWTRAKYNRLTPAQKKIVNAENQRIRDLRIKAKEAKTVKRITPDHYTISRGTVDNPADFPTTLIDYTKLGKTKHLKSKVDDSVSPDKIDIRGDVDSTTKEMLELFEQNKRQYVSTGKTRPDQAFLLREAERKGHVKPWADADVYPTVDAQYLADSSLRVGKFKNEIPAVKPDAELERIYQTLMAQNRPLGKTGGREIGDKNFDHFLRDVGISPPKPKRGSGTNFADVIPDNPKIDIPSLLPPRTTKSRNWVDDETAKLRQQFKDDAMVETNQFKALQKAFTSSAKSTHKKSQKATKQKADKVSGTVATGSALINLPPALDFDVTPKMDNMLDAGLAQDSMTGYDMDSISKQGQDMMQDFDQGQSGKSGTDTVIDTSFEQDIIPKLITGEKTTGKTGFGFRTGFGFDETVVPPEIIIPKIIPASSFLPDFLDGGMASYEREMQRNLKTMYMRTGVKDTPFETHNITDWEYSLTDFDEKKRKLKSKKKSTKKKKKVNVWGF